MRHILRHTLRSSFPLLLAALAAGACQARGEQTFIDKFGGEPYTGWVEVDITTPDGETHRRHGKASAHFVEKGKGRAQLVVFGAIDNEKGDASFAPEGVYDASGGWKSDVGGIRLQIGPNGEISGGGTAPPQRFRFSGLMSDSALDLTSEVELLQATDNGMPEGTTFRFEYDLSRADAEARADATKAGAGGGGRAKGKCRKVRWEMRPVAAAFGEMDMVRVPICLEK